MATINSFEELEVWKKSRILAKEIYSLINNNLNFKNNKAIYYQILKSSGSLMDNIAEGFERGNKTEFIYFLSVAKGSAAELKSQIIRAFDYNFINEIELEKYLAQTNEILKMISGLIKYLKTTEIKGIKYK